MEYEIVASVRGAAPEGHVDLQKRVQNRMKDGWKPLGAPFYDGQSRFFQAVVRDDGSGAADSEGAEDKAAG